MYLLYCAMLGTLVVRFFRLVVTLMVTLRRGLQRRTKPPTATQEKKPFTANSGLRSDAITVTKQATTPSPLAHQHSNPIPQLYALVIGINDYLKLQPLKGAVPDADSISEFLIKDLGVPPSHITELRNSSASRSRIIQAFRDLRDNAQIAYGSPILIYFAGHGGEAEPEERYGVINKVQVIFPYDYGVECEGKKINCITDKMVAGLLNELARAKGDNITVIFDSCHSASGNRGVLDMGERRARRAAVEFAIPADMDEDILPPISSADCARHTNLPLCADQSSHIYFAACGSDELAWEADGQGAFTAALLEEIRASGADKITYQNLMSQLPCLPKQSPHCYGVYKNRILFNASVPSRKAAYIPVIYNPVHHTLTLQAGVASGVTRDSLWEVRVSAAEGDVGVVGKIKADSPGVSSTALTLENQGDESFWSRCASGNRWKEGKKLYARQIKSGSGNELRVWFSPAAKQLIFPGVESGAAEDSVGGEHEVGYVHSARDSADIAVDLYQPGGMGEGHHPGSALGSLDGPGAEPEVIFRLCNPQAEKYGIATLRQRKPARRPDVETVLFAAARWNWHLHRMNPNSDRSIKMEMFKNAEKRTINGDLEWNFVKEEKVDSNEADVVDINLREEDMYAVRLKGTAELRLYVWMFYFDTTTFSIIQLFAHSVSNTRADPVIPKKGDFVIGDGADGGFPLAFEVDSGETLDVGYLKVFWSTDPLELDYIGQDSAFEMKVGAKPRKPNNWAAGLGSEWGSAMLTLVQRSKGD